MTSFYNPSVGAFDLLTNDVHAKILWGLLYSFDEMSPFELQTSQEYR